MKQVDFTTREPGSASRGNRTVEVCPKCGRNGEKRQATLGATVYTHIADVVIPGIDGGLRATDSCRVEAEAAAGA